jgi:cytoskeletal protein CcmA (bactofilin family)
MEDAMTKASRPRAGTGGIVFVVAVAAFILLSAGPAAAAGSSADEPRVSVTGPVRVGAGERIDGAVVSVDGPVRIIGVVDGDVFAVHGNVNVSGRVTGSVTTLDGDITVTGQVGDGVTAISGRAIIGANAEVVGDVRSSERPDVAAGASVDGDVSKTNFAAWFTLAGWIALLLWWLAVTVSLLLLGVFFVALFPRAAQAVATVGRASTGLSIVWGAVLGLAVPLLAGGLASTFVGLPLSVGILLALAVAFPMGYVMTALVIGRTLAGRVGDIPAFLIGFAILRAIAIIPGLGWVVGFLAAAFGVGALAVAAWRAGHRPPEPVASATPDSGTVATAPQ